MENSPTLVLDSHYVPIAKVPWQRAISLLFLGKVEVIEEYEDKEIKSVTFSIKMPSIIRFLNSVKIRKRVVKFSRSNIYIRDKGMCQYCGKGMAPSELTYDHVIPASRGGTTTWENIVVACMGCNQKKRNRTPEEAKMRLLSKPTRPKKIEDHSFITIQWKNGDPLSWKDWLVSHKYWNDSLEE